MAAGDGAAASRTAGGGNAGLRAGPGPAGGPGPLRGRGPGWRPGGYDALRSRSFSSASTLTWSLSSPAGTTW